MSAQRLKPKAAETPRHKGVGARARRWRQLMDEGAFPSMSALARAEGVTPAAVSKALLRLKRQEEESQGAMAAK